MVPEQNLLWQQGEDGTIEMIYSAGTPPTPVNLTGYKLRMDIRAVDDTLLLTLNSEDITETPPVDQPGTADNEATLGTAGEITIIVSRLVTLDGGVMEGHLNVPLNYDVFLRNPSNRQTKILKGTITIQPSVTRWQ